jgi:mono/diheme cytochrome c family protein
MRAPKSIAVALAGMVLFGALTLAGAVPDKKKSKAPAASAALLAEGKKAYDANNCAACHLIGAKGGKTGPELSHIGKSKKPAEFEKVIRDPKKVNPKALMPAYPADKIDAKKLKALVAYLVSLK